MSGPLQVQCDRHRAAIGVPCDPSGTCCAARIAKALLLSAGVTPESLTRAIDPGTATPAVVGDEPDIKRPAWMPAKDRN